MVWTHNSYMNSVVRAHQTADHWITEQIPPQFSIQQAKRSCRKTADSTTSILSYQGRMLLPEWWWTLPNPEERYCIGLESSSVRTTNLVITGKTWRAFYRRYSRSLEAGKRGEDASPVERRASKTFGHSYLGLIVQAQQAYEKGKAWRRY